VVEKAIIAGFGGQGILFFGKVLAQAGMDAGHHVTYFPSYGPEVRGGRANCHITVSSQESYLPMIAQADAVVAMSQPAWEFFATRLKPDGLAVLNASMVAAGDHAQATQRIVAVPDTAIAVEAGDIRRPTWSCSGPTTTPEPSCPSRPSSTASAQPSRAARPTSSTSTNRPSKEASTRWRAGRAEPVPRRDPAMDILYLDHATELGGAEHSLLELLRALDRGRFAPTLACPAGRLADRAAQLDVPVVHLAVEKLKSRNPLASLWRLRRGSRRLRRLLADGGFALVHANTLRTAVYASTAARAAGVAFVWHVRDSRVPGLTRAWLLRRCDAAIATSQFLAHSLGRSRKLHLVPNGIDPARVPPEAAAAAFRSEFGIPPEAPVVGCLGRIRPWKGQGHFLQVAARLAAHLPEAVFLVVGSTLFPDPGRDYQAELRAEAERLGITDRVRFTGHRDDPLAALGAMSIVANCSEHEPFGRVLIEAMACRRPVVAFRSGAVPEIVVDGSTALLVPFGDVDAMAQAVLDLVRSPMRAEAYGEAGRQRVAAHFSLQASTAKVEALYTQFAEAQAREAQP